MFADFAVALIFFFSFLTLKAWDIGALEGGDEAASLQAIARTCAWWMIAIGTVVTLHRLVVLKERWFVLSGATMLQVVLHGLGGLSYLMAWAIAGPLGAILLAATRIKRGGTAVAEGGAR